MTFSREFNPPVGLSLAEQVAYCKRIVEIQRKEGRLLRKDTYFAKLAKIKAEKEAAELRQKYNKSQEELKKAREEIKKLKQEIERLTKTNSRYQISLFDHGNFKSQDDNLEKKLKGGQLNHVDTNREGQGCFPGYETYQRKRIYAKSCGKCGSSLERASSFRGKVLLDVVIKPEIIQMIIESERQWCGVCKMEVNAKDSNSLPFTEYGLNTFLMVMILRFKAHCSMSTISKVVEVGFGLTLSKSDISNILKTSANYLGKRYNELKQAVREGNVIYADETGWMVKGHSAWMWIMASEDIRDDIGQVTNSGTTVYVAAESRGKGIAQDIYGNSQAKCMTDGLASYTNSIPKDKHLFCWAHVLRFAFEETIHSKKTSMSIFLRDELVRIYHIKQDYPEYSKKQREKVLAKELDQLLNLTSAETSFNNIQSRIKDQRLGLINSLLETDSGTNNLAERELRPLVLGRNISYGSDTYTGMETTAILGSIIQTLGRQKDQPLIPELKSYLNLGIQDKYPQYIHIPFIDTS